MKTYFFEGKDDLEIILPNKLIKVLPKKIGVFTTVQHIEKLDNILKQLKDEKIEVITNKLNHAKYENQILGCSVKELKDDSKAYLYIGDGEFHPKALVLKNEKKVFSYNPYNNEFKIFDEKTAIDLRKKQRAGLTKFHVSTNIGVLITLKPGQNRTKRAEKLKELYPDKNFYLLIADTIDFGSLEDFNYVECFVNTACPRIGYDDTIKIGKPVINLEEIDNIQW